MQWLLLAGIFSKNELLYCQLEDMGALPATQLLTHARPVQVMDPVRA